MPAGRVKIRNGTVVSSDGSLLRGAAAWVYAWGKHTGVTEYSTDPEYYQRIVSAGLNSVRVVCFDSWQRTNQYPHWDIAVDDDRRSFLAELDRVVELATAHDLNVMINYHDSGHYDQNHLSVFWEWVAPRYVELENVFYELTNEPVQWSPSEYTGQVIEDQQCLYRRVRELAPETHLVLLSFARIDPLKPGFPAERVTAQLTDVDWSNASMGFHAYECSSSAPILAARAEFPVINTEIDLPTHVGGEEKTVPIDGETYGVKTMERLAISWFAWNVEGFQKFQHGFIDGVLKDARNEGYEWTAGSSDQEEHSSQSAISRFFTIFK